jgi:hypothetical protein
MCFSDLRHLEAFVCFVDRARYEKKHSTTKGLLLGSPSLPKDLGRRNRLQPKGQSSEAATGIHKVPKDYSFDSRWLRRSDVTLSQRGKDSLILNTCIRIMCRYQGHKCTFAWIVFLAYK